MKNKCTCPASVDITFTGHLPDCPQPAHEARQDRGRVVVGKVCLTRGRTGLLWLNHAGGEAMQLKAKTEARLARLLEAFFHGNF